MATPLLITVIDELSTWYPPGEAIEDLLTHMGAYTHALVARWTPRWPLAAAGAWADPYTLPADASDRLRDRGIEPLLTAAGHELAIASGVEPAAYAGALAEFVARHRFGGVNLETDLDPPLGPERAGTWVRALVTELRERLPPETTLSLDATMPSHREPPFAWVDEALAVDHFLVRCFEPPLAATLDRLAVTALDPGRLLIGLRVPAPGGPPPDDLVQVLRDRLELGERLAGVCVWSWATDRKLFSGRWSETLARALPARRG